MASFFDRVLAYLIDILLIGVFIFVINQGLPETDNSELDQKMNEMVNQLMNEEITEDEFVGEYKVLLYNSQKKNVLSTSINVALYIAYFIIFQFMLGGQTIGKKVLHLRVVTGEDGKVSIWQMILRSLFMFSIVSGILYVVLLNVLSMESYINAYLLISILDLLFLIVSLLFILYRKDKRGLHDLMANTKVIKEV